MQAYIKNIIMRFCLTHCNWHCRNKRKPLCIQEPAFSIIHVSFYDFYMRHCHFQPKLKPDAQVPTRNYICVKVHACEKKDLLHFHGSSQDLILDVYQTCMLVVSIDVDARTQCKMLAKRSAHGVCSHASCAHGRWLSLGREFIYELCIHNNATIPCYDVLA